MPRDGSGVAQVVAGTNTVAANTTILSALERALVNDIYNIFNTAWPVALGGTGGTTPASSLVAQGAAAATQLGSPVNLGLAASVSGSALTIALKGADGNDPSATNPVYIPFRNVTPATGTPSLLTVTAATSLVINSTATMGFTSAAAGRLWIVGFNDGGTFRFGAINCLSGTSIFALAGAGIASSTTVSTSADNAHVFYSGTGVTSKAYTVLGYMDFSLTTAGTWDEVPDVIRLFAPGVELPGEVVQRARLPTGAVSSAATTVPFDDTIPQSTEGDQYMSQAITPVAAANLLKVAWGAHLTNSAAPNNMVAALFRDSGADAVAATALTLSTASYMLFLAGAYAVLAGSTAATTMKVRAGGSAAGTTTFNGQVGSRLLGGVLDSYLEVEEIMA